MTGATISDCRDALGLTAREFAAAFGVSTHTVYRWESDQRPPTGLSKLLMARLHDKLTEQWGSDRSGFIADLRRALRARGTLGAVHVLSEGDAP